MFVLTSMKEAFLSGFATDKSLSMIVSVIF